MPVFTENYNLKKPLPNENYNVQDQNDNMDIIDSELKKLEQMLENIEVPVTSVNGETGDVVLTADDLGAETPAGAQAKAEAAAAAAANAVQANLSAHEQKTASTSQAGHVKLSSATNSISEDVAATPKAVKAAMDAANSAQSDLSTHESKAASASALGHVYHAIYNVTLDTSWSGSSAPFSKTVTVNGIQASDTPIIDVVMSGTYSTDTAIAEAWGYIYRAVTADGSITFYATEKPTINLPIQIKVVR